MKLSLRTGSAMRRALPLNGLASGYVCLQCRHRVFALAGNARILHPVSTSSRHYASSGGDDNTFTERLRRRLWKTDPPGPKDPYSSEKWDARKAAKEANRIAKEDATATNPTGQDFAGEQYEPATTWDGLEQIGGATGWWEEAWDRANQFDGFMAPSKMQSKEDISIAIHRALVEVYALKEADLPNAFPILTDTSYDSEWGAIGFQQSENGITIPVFPNDQIRQRVLDSLTDSEPREDSFPAAFAVEDAEDFRVEETEVNTEEETEANTEEKPEANTEEKTEANTEAENQVTLDERASSEEGELEALTAHDAKNSEGNITVENETPSSTPLLVDTSWLTVSFDDIDIKFAVLKRVMQLTGIRIPDPAIADLTSAKRLLGHLVRKPKPKKLADRLIAQEELTSLPNLQIMDRRYTPIDKEKEIGRWKIIERELIKRDLPVTGPS